MSTIAANFGKTPTIVRHSSARVPSSVIATSILVGTEIMFFTALISAYLVIKSSFGNWVPPGEIRLPVYATALNTVILLSSGLMMFLSWRNLLKNGLTDKTKSLYLYSITLGVFFVVFQGYEWVKLIGYGLTLTSSIFGACFFLLIGSHALHAVGAIVAMLVVYYWMASGSFRKDHLISIQIFWYLVVGIWPLLYGLVYF